MSNNPFEESFQNGRAVWENLAKQWQDYQSLFAKGGSNDAEWATRLYGQFQSGQQIWMRALQTFFDTAVQHAGQHHKYEDFVKATGTYRKEMSQKFQDAVKGAHHKLKDYSKMWDEFVGTYKEMQGLGSSFFEPLRQRMGLPEMPDMSNWVKNPVSSLQGAFDQVTADVLDAPGLGLYRNQTGLVNQAFKAYILEKEAEAAYNEMVAQAWAEVYPRMMQEVWERGQDDKPIKSVKELSRVWAGVVDEIFLEVFKSEAYVQKQLAFLNASLSYRKYKRALVELSLESNDLPTLTQVDDLIERVYTLRKALRASEKSRGSADRALAVLTQQVAEQGAALAALQRELAALTSAPQAPEAPAAEAPAAPKAKRAPRKAKSAPEA